MPASYVKMHSTITDFSSGIQSVNQLRDNFQADHGAWVGEHSVREPGSGSAPVSLSQAFGRHNTPKVPRAAMRTALSTSGFSIVIPGAFVVQPIVSSFARISTGVFFIGIVDLQDFYAEVEADQSSASPVRVAIPRTSFGGRGAPVGITIECYEQVGAGFDLTDFDFSAIIYGATA